MPRLRKDQPIMLNDEQLYAVMCLLLPLRPSAVKKPRFKKPSGSELDACIEAYDIITSEFWARAEEQHRIDAELELIKADYEGRK